MLPFVLRFAEELVLLLLDDDTGALLPVPDRDLRCALAGAVLMDLALENRIDTDIERLILLDPAPVGDPLLDPSLTEIAQTGETRDTAYWINCLAQSGGAGGGFADLVHAAALNRLVERGIVEREPGEMLALAARVARSRRYPKVDGEAGREVESRILAILFSEEVPGPRDVMLISLVNACGIFARLLTPAELAEVQPRIELISRMDLIGRTVFQAIRQAGIPSVDAAAGRSGPTLNSRSARAQMLAAMPRADGGGLPILGNARGMAGDLIAYLAQQYRELGPVFRVRVPSRAITVLAGPEANRFMQRQGTLYLRTIDTYAGFTRALGGHRFILSMDGAEHRRIRKVLANGYSHRFFLDHIDDAVQIVTRELDDLPEHKPLSALPILQRIIGGQIGVVCTGVRGDEYLQDLTAYMDRLFAITGMRRPQWMARTPRMRRARLRMEALQELIVTAHESARQDEDRTPDLIDDVLALHRADPQFLPETELALACVGPFIAGLHTAASVATCMLYELLRHPDAMAQVQAEADELFADGGPTAAKLQALDATQRAGMETMRLHQVTPVQMRTAVTTFEFEGFVIPSGTEVMVANTVPHLLAEHFPEPTTFDIDRYTPERAEHKAPGVYAPFGLGTHRCLGSGFTGMALALTLATMLRHADITMRPPGYRLRLNRTSVAAPKPSFKIAVTRRS